MLRKYKPQVSERSINMAFYEKSRYHTIRAYKLTRMQLEVLILCNLVQVFRNTSITSKGLRPYVPVRERSVKRYLTVLESKGLLKEVAPLYPRGKSQVVKGTKKNVQYNVTEYGESIIKYFNEKLNGYTERFKSDMDGKWRKIKNDNELDRMREMGMIRDKPGAGRRKE